MNLHIKYCNSSLPAEMFDHSSKQTLQGSSLTIQGTTSIYKNKATHQLTHTCDIKQEGLQIARVFKMRKNRYFIQKANCPENMYVVAGTNKVEKDVCVELKQKSVVKLGKSQLQVLKVNLPVKRKSQLEHIDEVFSDKIVTKIEQENKISQDFYENSTYASTYQNAPCCRYCYKKSVESTNLLTFVCKCEGSAKYVHQQCLQSWICQKSKYRECRPGIFHAEKAGIKCQICNDELNFQQILPCFNHDLKYFFVLLIENNEAHKSLWVLKIQPNLSREFVVGRKNENSVIVADLSVSRQHCVIEWDSNTHKLILSDLNSKFGTLLKKDVVQITKPVTLQVGRTKLQVELASKQKYIIKKLKGLINIFQSSKSGKREASDNQHATQIQESGHST